MNDLKGNRQSFVVQKNSLFIIKFAVKTSSNPPSFKGPTAEQQRNPPAATQPQQTDDLRPASPKLTTACVPSEVPTAPYAFRRGNQKEFALTNI